MRDIHRCAQALAHISQWPVSLTPELLLLAVALRGHLLLLLAVALWRHLLLLLAVALWRHLLLLPVPTEVRSGLATFNQTCGCKVCMVPSVERGQYVQEWGGLRGGAPLWRHLLLLTIALRRHLLAIALRWARSRLLLLLLLLPIALRWHLLPIALWRHLLLLPIALRRHLLAITLRWARSRHLLPVPLLWHLLPIPLLRHWLPIPLWRPIALGGHALTRLLLPWWRLLLTGRCFAAERIKPRKGVTK